MNKVLNIKDELKVSYCISTDLRDEQIRINIKKVSQRIEQATELKNEPIALVGFAPSLNKTWKELKKFKNIITCSGAHKFLIEKGIIPTYHADLEPRDHKIKMLGDVQKETEYLIASTVHPKYLDYLNEHNANVKLWHIFANDDEAVRILPRGEWAITGGSSIGLRLLTLSRFLGYTDFHIFGMDGCMSEEGTHTTTHPNAPKEKFETVYNGKTYFTTPSMLFVAKETWKELDQLPDCKATFYGEGLVQDMSKDYKHSPKHGSLVAFNRPELISKEYISLNKKLHDENPMYGMGGAKHKDTVIKLAESINTRSILDFGCQPLDAKVLTPKGWVEMQDISIGGQVIGLKGSPINVIGKHTREMVPVYKVTFQDNAELIVDGNHLWAVRTVNHQNRDQKYIVKNTLQLIDDLRWNGYDSLKWRIPVVSKIDFGVDDQIIDPYIIGVLIGDGSFVARSPVLSAANKSVVKEVEKCLPEGIYLNRIPERDENRAAYRVVKTGSRNSSVKNSITQCLVDNNLFGKRSWEKFIPQKYLFGSIKDRISLLQGLVDTDGEIRDKHLSYSTTSKRLSEDLIFLVQSLGGIARATVRSSKFTYKGEVKNGRQSYVIHIKVPQDIVPTRAKPWSAREKYHPNRLIDSIEYIGEQTVMGITVDSEDSLYVTENCIVTHNCGKGMLGKALDFPIYEYDPAIPEKSQLPKPADLVIVSDVLEHIEPDKLQFVLDELRRLTKKIGYFVISTRAAVKTYANGQNAHLIIQGKDWWNKKLIKFFDIGTIIEKEKECELHIVVAPKTKALAPKEDITTLSKDGLVFKFHTPSETTKWRADTLFTKEPATINWINSMKKDAVLYDVGANVGSYSILAGVKGLKVYAFEPEAENHAMLVKNIELNNINANAYCLAMSDKNGVGELFVNGGGAGQSCHSFGENLKPNGQAHEARHKQGCVSMTLDEMVKMGLPSPDYLKIDVDGLEYNVIKGGDYVLKNGLTSLLVEVNPEIPEHNSMVDYLCSIGFEFDEQQVEKAKRKEGAFKGVAEYVFTKKKKDKKAEAYLVRKVNDTAINKKPFPYIYVENVFPKDLYKSIMANMPDTYEEIEKTRGTKGYPKRFTATPTNEFWQSVNEQLLSGAFKKSLLDKFSIQDDNFSQDLLLVRDNPGYAIPPHTDSLSKIITVLFYLPESDAIEGEGTSIFIPNKKGFICKDGRHYKFEDFKKVKTMPFKPNSMFAFARTDNSFHGVEPCKEIRNVLLYNIKK